MSYIGKVIKHRKLLVSLLPSALKALITPRLSRQVILDVIRRLHPRLTQFELIRFGPNGDGGYLIPNDLAGVEARFSPGVADMTGFEVDCLKHGMKVFMADASVEKPRLDFPETQYSFIKKYIGYFNDKEYMTMDSWFDWSGLVDRTELLLQMDIEGHEYPVIMSMSEALIKRFRIIVVEFHRLDTIFKSKSHPEFLFLTSLIIKTFEKLLKTHVPVHIHPNNALPSKVPSIKTPPIMEFTFLRKDRAELGGYRTDFPHKLDYDNTGNEHFALPKDWYRQT